MKTICLALFLALTLLAPPAIAAQEAVGNIPHAAQLSSADRALLSRIETYLNNLKSVSADFLQINDSGNMRHGKIMIQRPGKMRVAYDPPSKDLIVADGTLVHMWDDELKQQSNVPEGSSLASFILRDPIKLSGDVTVTALEHRAATIEVTLVSKDDPGEGQLTLIFEDKPLQLRQWRVLDAQGRTTGVSLENAREGVTLDSNLFNFVAPTFGAPRQ